MASQRSITLDHTASSDNPQLALTAQQLQTMQLDDKVVPPLGQQQMTSEYFKDGKICYTEPKLLAENHPLVHHRIAAFRDHRRQFEAAHATATVAPAFEFPREFADLIVALTQDSEESTGQLVHRINDTLSPFQRNEQFTDLFLESIERAVKSCAGRTKYGLSPRVLAQLDGGPTMIPHHLSISRWEAHDIQCLPADLQAAITHRRNTRAQMGQAITTAFELLSSGQQLALLHTKHRKSQPADDVKTKEEIELENERRRKKDEERRIREEEKKKREEEKKIREEERRKREEDKRRREEEKKRKEQSQLRLTSLFTKAPEDKTQTSGTLGTELPKANPSMFPPFYVKEHVSVHRWPNESLHSADFYSQLTAYETSPNEPVSVSKDLQQQFLQELQSRAPNQTQKRGISKTIDLRSVLLGPNISHDAFSHQALRMKLLQFYEDVRPAYYGTWTKKSNTVTARNPLGQDFDLIDYEHDSEAEWEPEVEGEEIQSGDEEDDDPSADVMDPEDAGWLVPEGYLSEDEGVDSDDEHSGRVVSRPVVRPAKKYTAIRPIAIGPIFDDGYDAEDDTLKQYEVRLLGDALAPYDPLSMQDDLDSTLVSGDEQTRKVATFTSEQASELIQIIEGGKTDAMPKLVSEAKSNKLLQDLPKRQIEMKIKDLAIKEKRGADTKPAWYFKNDQST